MITNPFVGPTALRPPAPLFGRSKELRELLQLLRARRIVLLHSPSGAGKSSLLHVGLIPLLIENEMDFWHIIRVNIEPSSIGDVQPNVNRYLLSTLVSLEDELPPEKRRPLHELVTLSLADYLKQRIRRPRRKSWPIVLIFDQFEEVLTTAPQAIHEKRAFFQGLGEALADEGVFALFAMREDHLGALAPYRGYLPTRASNTFRLDLFSREAAKETMIALMQLGGRTFPAVEKLIDDLAQIQVQQIGGETKTVEGIYVEPVQMQVVCRQIWAKMPDDDKVVDLADLKAYGDVTTALSTYYADAVAPLAGSNVAVERKIRTWVGTKLINNNVRVQVRQGPEQSEGLENELIQKLLDTYIIRAEQRLGANWYELSHDRLVRPVLQDNERWYYKSLHSMQKQAEIWAHDKNPNQLLRAGALEEAESWADANGDLITQIEREYLAASRELRSREIKESDRENRRNVIIVMALVISVVSAFWGYVLYFDAKKATAEAENNLVKARDGARVAAIYAVDGDPTTQALLLRDVRRPKEIRQWRQLAMEVLRQPVSKTVFRGHTDGVQSVVFSTDGMLLLSTSDDGTVRVWRLDQSEKDPPVILNGHAGGVTSAAWSPDKTQIVTVSDDGTVQVWRSDGTGEPVSLKNDDGPVTFAAWSPDGTRIVTASDDGTVQVWRSDGTGEPVSLKGHDGPVTSAAWSPDGTRIVTASQDKTAWVWGLDGTAVARLKGHTDWVLSAAWSPNGTRIVTVSDDKTARVWRLDGTLVALLNVHPDVANSAAGSPDKTGSAAASDDKTAQVGRLDGMAEVGLRDHESPVRSATRSRDVRRVMQHSLQAVRSDARSRNGTRIVTAPVNEAARMEDLDGAMETASNGYEGWVLSAAWSPDGTRIVTTLRDGTAQVWQADGTGAPVSLKGHDGPVTSAAWSPDGTRIVTASKDGTARVWGAADSAEPQVLSGHTDAVLSAGFSPDGQEVVTCSADGTARRWSLNDPNATKVIDNNTSTVMRAVWSPDGQRVLTTSLDNKVQIWSLTGGAPVQLISPSFPRWAEFSPDGKWVVAGASDGKVRIWSADGKGVPQVFDSKDEWINTVSFSPLGDQIATASKDGRVRIFDRKGTLLYQTEPIGASSAMWSPKGANLLVTVTNTAQLWSNDLSKVLYTLTHPKEEIRSAAFSPDGQHVVTASLDGTASVWSAADGRFCSTLSGHKQGLTSAAFSPDGEEIVTASMDGTAWVWSTSENDPCSASITDPLILSGHEGEVNSAFFSPDGQQVLTAADDGTARVWPVPSIQELRQQLWRATSECLALEDYQFLVSFDEETAKNDVERCELGGPQR